MGIIELACGVPQFTRNHFVDLEEKDKISEFIKNHNNRGIYKTVCTYESKDIEKASYTAPLVFDIDSGEDLEKAREDAVWVYKRLIAEGFVDGDLAIYFSGSKGFHIEIAQEALPMPSLAFLMEIYKIIAENFKKVSPNKCIDTKIYEKRRLFRIPFSQHEKTDLYKNLLTPDELAGMPMDQIKELCKTRRFIKLDKSGVVPNDRIMTQLKTLIKMWREKKEKYLDSIKIDLKDVRLYPCIKYVLDNPPPPGDRNDTAYNLALYLKKQGVGIEEAIGTMVEQWHSGLSEFEITNTVRSAYRGGKNWTCRDREYLQKHCNKALCPIADKCDEDKDFIPIDEVVDRTEEYFFGKRKVTNLTTGYDQLDEVLCGIQENDFIVVCGPVGSGKSQVAAQIAMANARNGKNVGFMSLEMTNEQVVTRFVQSATGIGNRQIVQQDFSETDKYRIKESFAELKKGLGLYFFSRDNIYSINKIEEIIAKGVASMGLHVLIIDHLRYIERDGSKKEHEEIDRITTKLQQITQRYNICIILLAHFTKGDDTKPREMSELLGGNSVYREATKILQIWRKIPKDPAEDAQMSDADRATRFIMLKNRFGTAGMCVMDFDKRTGTYHQSAVGEEIKRLMNAEASVHKKLNAGDLL